VVHFLEYTLANFLNGFYEPLLQERHELKRDGGSVLRQETIKLTMNSNYGHACIQSTRFSTTSVMSESHLKNHPGYLKDPRLEKITLMGTTPVTRGKRTREDLLYALTRSGEDSKICNILQVSGWILAQSRLVFFGIVSHLMDVLDPRKAQLCYIDTDSAVYVTALENVADCLRPGLDPSVLDKVMADPRHERHQGGKMKHESTHTAGLFRCPKCYYLAGEVGEPVMKRMRGVQRRIQFHLCPAHFGQDVRENVAVTHSVSLRPTRGFQMTLLEEDKSLSHCLNLKRVATVSVAPL
jgi:hypothetical protein